MSRFRSALRWAFAAAIVVALLGGSAQAASLITGKRVKNNSLTGADIRNRSLTGADLAEQTISARHVAAETIGEDELAVALLQKINAANTTPGPPGPPGPVAIANITIAQGSAVLCGGTTSCSIGSASATCPAGTKPFAGGVATEALNGTFVGTITRDGASGAMGYTVAADNYGSSSSAQLLAFAYCSKDVASVTFPNGTVGRSSGSDATADALERRRTVRGAAR